MGQRQLASVLFAVLGVFMAVTRLPMVILQLSLLAQLRSFNAEDTGFTTAYSLTLLASMIIAVLLGILLVLNRTRLSERLFPADTQPLVARDLQAVALSVLGCYFVIQSICQLVWHGMEWSAVAQLVLGIGLFLGARGVARLWAAARSAGSSSTDERAV